MKEDWIAIFKSDLRAKVFLKPGIYEDVIYWIKRFLNGKTFNPSSSVKVYVLSSFEIYNSALQSTTINFDESNNWKCLHVEEFARDNFVSYCYCNIQDTDNKVHKVNMHGSDTFSTTTSQHLYFSGLMFFLRFLSKYKN